MIRFNGSVAYVTGVTVVLSQCDEKGHRHRLQLGLTGLSPQIPIFYNRATLPHRIRSQHL
jgi:hypothetical protein